jgi:Fe-S cluster assembly protein SufD
MSILVSPSPVPNSHSIDLASTVLDRDAYLIDLLNQIVQGVENHPNNVSWLQELRERAVFWVRQSILPTTRDEEWRFTDLSLLRKIQFHVDTRHSDISGDRKALQFLPEADTTRLVFVDGVYSSELSSVAGLPDGVIVSNLTNLPGTYSQRIQEYLAQSEGAHELFTALNTSGMVDAAVVWLSKNAIVETPIHLVFIAIGKQSGISLPRCLVVAETGSSVTLVEEYRNFLGAENTNLETKEGTSVRYLTNAVTEIWVGENARVNHTRIQTESGEAVHIGKTAVSQARYSWYGCHAVTFGGKLSRHNLEILQTGEQTETVLNGLTTIAGEQLADTHSAIALNYPHGTSKQLHKCILSDRAHGVFNGKIFVPKPAQLTNAAQLNQNLLLSSKTRIDTKPQLEITADNVKCAHGATVSQLEDDEIFYLQSRGIDANDARHLLVNAFAAEVINQIPVPSVRHSLMEKVSNQ